MLSVDYEYESDTEEEVLEDFISPDEYDEEDWIAYHSDTLWHNWNVIREKAFHMMEPSHISFSDYCAEQFKDMALNYS